MKIVEAYMKFGLYRQWKEAVSRAMIENGIDEQNSDLHLVICEHMESDETDYPISNESECLKNLHTAASKAAAAVCREHNL
ncbi:MAG: hypothetical protein ACOC24_00785 [Desulfovibrionales bacterium]